MTAYTAHVKTSVMYHTPRPKKSGTWKRKQDRPPLPKWALVIDTETTAIATPTMPGFEDWKPEGQALLFGRMLEAKREGGEYKPKREFLFYPDNLPAEGLRRIKAGLRARRFGMAYEMDDPPHLPLSLMPLSDFLDVFYSLALRRVATVVGFNLPFELSRLAFEASPAKGSYLGGFSLALWADKDGKPS